VSWPDFFEVCRDRGGVVRLSDAARRAGLDPGTVRRRALREGWWLPYPNVGAAPGTPVDARARAQAAVLYLRGPGVPPGPYVAAATRWTAAHLLGVSRGAPSRPQVVVDHRRRVGRHDHLEALRARDLAADEVRPVDGVPTVSSARLIRDLAGVCELDALRAVAIDLMKARKLDLGELGAALDRWTRFPGRPRAVQVVDQLSAAGRTDSPLEFEARDRFARAGVPLDRGQVAVPIVGGRPLSLDLGIAAIRFAIEVDSFAFHSNRGDLNREARRQNAIAGVADDWRVLHLTWDIMRNRWPAFLDQVREVIAAQSRRHLGLPWPRPGDLRA